MNDITPKSKGKQPEREFERLTLNQRVQHMILIFSFTLLIVTGLPILAKTGFKSGSASGFIRSTGRARPARGDLPWGDFCRPVRAAAGVERRWDRLCVMVHVYHGNPHPLSAPWVFWVCGPW